MHHATDRDWDERPVVCPLVLLRDPMAQRTRLPWTWGELCAAGVILGLVAMGTVHVWGVWVGW